MDAEFDGMATALSTALYRDGQAVPVANMPMGGYKLTGLGDATTATDALNRQAADARYLSISTAVADLKATLDEAVHTISTVASASTCDIGAAATDRVSITGTTTITSFGTDIDAIRFVSFMGALLLTHNATSLILPTGANITTAAGDCAIFASDASGNWRCLDYQRADGSALAIGSNQVVTASITDNNVTLAKIATQAAATVLANVTGGAAAPTAASVSAVLDLVPGTPTKGDLIVRDTSVSARIAAGTSGYILTSNGTGALPTYQAASAGKLVSRAYSEYSTNAGISTVIPYDDTIPQITEGTEIVTASITPTSASNRVRVTFSGYVDAGAIDPVVVALFRDAGASAIYATAVGNTASPSSLAFVFEHVPATTSATTYRIRVGPSAAGTIRLNGTTAGRRLGGVGVASLVVEEITP